MPIGPGKYDDLCTQAREGAKATGAVLIIMEGNKGAGFSVQAPPELLMFIPGFLREIAKEMGGTIVPIGPGKYDGLCTQAREGANATGAILIIVEGRWGAGFSVQAPLELLRFLPEFLKGVAKEIELCYDKDNDVQSRN